MRKSLVSHSLSSTTTLQFPANRGYNFRVEAAIWDRSFRRAIGAHFGWDRPFCGVGLPVVDAVPDLRPQPPV